jgi:threonine dehydratase
MPLGAFKARGGINLLANLSIEERQRGLITASTGNHGQSIANACKIYGVRAVIVLPEGSNPLKVNAMRSLGAELIFHGTTFDESHAYAEQLSESEGYRYVHPVNEPLLIAGVATETLEIIEDFPDVQDIFLPLGGGSGIAGACLVSNIVNPSIRIWAAQSESAPAGYMSWREGQLLQSPTRTFAEGLATESGYYLPQEIMRHKIHDFVLVSDDEIRYAMGLLIEKSHTMAEGAGATSTAGAIKRRESIKGKKVVLVVTGGNVTLAQLRDALDVYERV